MRFTDAEIRALVETGQYSDERATEWVTRCLIERRTKIGRVFFDKVLPLDHFEINDSRLTFDDLAVKHQFTGPRSYVAAWFRFDNETEQKSALSAASLELPVEVRGAGNGEHFAADIHAGDPAKTVTVYLRKRNGHLEVVGIDRRW
jgi:hypothetical protein